MVWKNDLRRETSLWEKLTGVIMVAGLIYGAYYWLDANLFRPAMQQDAARKAARVETIARGDVEGFVRTFLEDTVGSPSIERKGPKNSRLEVTYEMPEAFLATSAERHFLMTTSTVIPQIFANFPDISEVNIAGITTLTDLRGHDEKKRVIRIAFDRATNASIRWEGVLIENLPVIATSFWAHPALRK